MEPQEMLVAADETFAELLQRISMFKEDQINQVPYADSWTPGQLAQHVIMSASGFVQMIGGPVKDTDRAPDAQVALIKGIFMDFGTKMKSPDFIVPPESVYHQKDLLEALSKIKGGLAATKDLDFTKTCTSFEIPGFDPLTRWEALSFLLYHTKRHVHQAEKIYLAFNNHLN